MNIVFMSKFHNHNSLFVDMLWIGKLGELLE